jgi:phage terminase large subunit
VLPFFLFPAQEDLVRFFLDCYDRRVWNACIKARYVGASYVTTMLMLHKLLFEADFCGTLSSNKKDSVDKKGSSKSLFEKIVQMYRWLPQWMQTIDMNKCRTSMLIRNPSINSSIEGESGDQIGRGGRSSWAVVDEAAFIERSESVIAALSENTDCASLVSTVNGTANIFYQIATGNEVPIFYYRWTADPRRTQEWREKQGRVLGERICKAELDCDFNATVEGQFIEAQWIQSAIDAVDKIPGLAEISSTTQAGLDVAIGGKNKNVLAIRKGGVISELKELPGSDTTQTAFKVDSLMRSMQLDVLCFDADGVGAGVSGTLANLANPGDYQIIQFHGGGRPSDRNWEGLERTSQELYVNKRIEAWAIVREALRKTHDHLTDVQMYPLDELISIPNHPNLITDLAKPLVKYSSTGKQILESKIDMRKRGIASPDFGDAVALAFYENLGLSWFESI